MGSTSVISGLIAHSHDDARALGALSRSPIGLYQDGRSAGRTKHQLRIFGHEAPLDPVSPARVSIFRSAESSGSPDANEPRHPEVIRWSERGRASKPFQIRNGYQDRQANAGHLSTSRPYSRPDRMGGPVRYRDPWPRWALRVQAPPDPISFASGSRYVNFQTSSRDKTASSFVGVLGKSGHVIRRDLHGLPNTLLVGS